MRTIRLDTDADGIATLTFDDPAGSVNTMNEVWQADLDEAVGALERDREAIRGVLLTSAKKTFFAGAELNGILDLTDADAAPGFARIEAMKKGFRRLETLGRPVVALLEGAALGGGWEVALAAHARFAIDDPKIRFGMPEVSLGLIPGGTGTTKTVRLLGLMAAQPYLIEGKLFGPHEAVGLGLVDGLGSTRDELWSMALEWIAAHPDAVQPWDRKDHRIPGGTPSSPKIAAGLAVAPAMLAQKTRGLYPAPQAALEAMVEGALVDYDTATRIESRKLAKLMVSQTTKNMVTAFFFGMNAIRSGRSRPPGFARWRPAKVGVLGAGMMGAGIAHANASRGIACVLKDVSAEKVDAGMKAIARIVDPLVAKGKLAEADAAKIAGLVEPTTNAADLDGCDLVIEAVFEQRALKAEVTREAEPMLAPDGVFASNTSTLPITGLAEASRRPERFVGLHFFSPVHRMQLVEIIRGARTSDETIARAFDYVQAIGKTPIVVNDSRGFFTSRVFGTYLMEGASMLAEGVPAAIVEHAAIAVGMPVGPLAMFDETSLSLSVHVIEQTRADLAAAGEPFETNAGQRLVERMVKELKRPGRAAGGGFYDYPPGELKRLWPGLADHFGSSSLSRHPEATASGSRVRERAGVRVGESADDVRALGRRMLVRASIETARCMAEGVLTSVHDANVGSILGIGFPAWTGGSMQYVYSVGVDRFLAEAEALASRHGDGFAVSPEVRQAIEKNARWHDEARAAADAPPLR